MGRALTPPRPPRPRPAKTITAKVNLPVQPELKARLAARARQEGVKMCALIRRYCRAGLEGTAECPRP
jgi:hypothetical protein